MWQRTAVRAVVGLVVLVAALVVDELVVRALLDERHLDLYIRYGALTSLVVVLFTLAWSDQVERLTGLVSAHPTEYLRAYLALGGAIGIAGGAALSSGAKAFASELVRQRGQELASPAPLGTPVAPWERPAGEVPTIPRGLGFLDTLLGALQLFGLLFVFVAWLVLIVPAQYFVYLVTGAPARLALVSPARAWVRVDGDEIQADVLHKRRALPVAAIESGFSTKPVTFTAALTAVALFALSELVG